MADFGRKRKNDGEAEGGSIRASAKPSSAGNESCTASRNPFSGLPVEVL